MKNKSHVTELCCNVVLTVLYWKKGKVSTIYLNWCIIVYVSDIFFLKEIIHLIYPIVTLICWSAGNFGD